MLKREDILHQEKLSLQLYMKYRKSLTITESAGIIKNTSGSENRRKLGNELYKHRPHDSSTHEKILNYYSESIALAPNNSEDLAMGYGNRSALFFHIKKYKECITDIDRALNITSNNLLKVKLLSRKAESLMMQNESIEFVCEEALQILQQFQESERKIYIDKLNKMLVKKNKIKSDVKPGIDCCLNDLLNFERSNEIPCASKSVAIKYDKKWGRHVVAKEDIKLGEIISVQKSIFTSICHQRMYLQCSYCTTIAYNSLPCEFCIYSIYCSETCRAIAWKKYHQYECVIYQHSRALNNGIKFTRFVLSAIYEVGSIDQMKEHILEIENTIDPRIKGFSNGIFDIEQKKNIYSLTNLHTENIPHGEKYAFIAEVCNCVYVLSKFTSIFGQMKNVLETDILLDEDRLFIAALILRTYYVFRTYSNAVQLKGTKALSPTDNGEKNFSLELFGSLINYSCLNNVKTVRINGGKNITFACRPIRKGSQLFKNFNELIIFVPKNERRFMFQDRQIACECIACIEDWSPISIPSIEQFFEITPTLDISIRERNRMLLDQTDPKQGCLRYTKNLLNQVCHHLALLNEKLTINCYDYYVFLYFLQELLYEVFSEYYFEMPEQCE